MADGPPMLLGWVIVYVDDPPAAREFYMQAFGLEGGFAVPGGSYAELDTGATKLGFASYTLGDGNFPGGVRRAATDVQPSPVSCQTSRRSRIAQRSWPAGASELTSRPSSSTPSAVPPASKRCRPFRVATSIVIVT